MARTFRAGKQQRRRGRVVEVAPRPHQPAGKIVGLCSPGRLALGNKVERRKKPKKTWKEKTHSLSFSLSRALSLSLARSRSLSLSLSLSRSLSLSSLKKINQNLRRVAVLGLFRGRGLRLLARVAPGAPSRRRGLLEVALLKGRGGARECKNPSFGLFFERFRWGRLSGGLGVPVCLRRPRGPQRPGHARRRSVLRRFGKLFDRAGAACDPGRRRRRRPARVEAARPLGPPGRGRGRRCVGDWGLGRRRVAGEPAGGRKVESVGEKIARGGGAEEAGEGEAAAGGREGGDAAKEVVFFLLRL